MLCLYCHYHGPPVSGYAGPRPAPECARCIAGDKTAATPAAMPVAVPAPAPATAAGKDNASERKHENETH